MGQKFYLGNTVILLIEDFKLFSVVTHETKNFVLEITYWELTELHFFNSETFMKMTIELFIHEIVFIYALLV